jgi:hypothetical protein
VPPPRLQRDHAELGLEAVDDGLRLGLNGMIEDVFARVRAWPKPAYAGEALTAEGASAAVKRLKPHLLLRLVRHVRCSCGPPALTPVRADRQAAHAAGAGVLPHEL